MACSQQGSLKAFTANLLHIAQRSLMGISSGAKELQSVRRHIVRSKYLITVHIPNELGLRFCYGRGHVIDTALGRSKKNASVNLLAGQPQRRRVPRRERGWVWFATMTQRCAEMANNEGQRNAR
jgi:hypothetical protein